MLRYKANRFSRYYFGKLRIYHYSLPWTLFFQGLGYHNYDNMDIVYKITYKYYKQTFHYLEENC